MSTNYFDQDQVQTYIDQIEGIEGEIATSKATHMNFAKSKREDIKEVFDEAKSNGIPRKVLANILERRGLEASIVKLDTKLDEDHKPLYDSLAEVFARYKPMKQTSMFDEPEDEGDDDGGGGFDPEFVDPAAEQQQREQEEGGQILTGDAEE